MGVDGRLLFLITSLAYGGAETQLVRLAIQLKKRGWDVLVVTMMQPKAYADELEAAGICVASLGIARKIPDPRPILHLVRLIRSWQPDVIHSHMVHANLLARIVRPLAPVNILICTAHNTNEGGRFREFLYRLTDPFCDLTTQVSEAGMERYVRVRAVPRREIRYIPNGVDTIRFRPDLENRSIIRRELGLKNNFLWLSVGRFDIQKDYPNILQALTFVVRKLPDAILAIVGDGPLRPAMEELAGNLGLRDSTMFLGTGRDVPGLMNAADGYVMSSAWEGMPVVLLEAAATELPIVATDVGGNREVVQDGKTGFLVPPKNPEALAGAMLRLMNLPEDERTQMGKAGRHYIQANYSLDRITDIWENLYGEFLAKKRIDDNIHGAEHVH
ncbi:glycosyltransferase [Methanothrix sp.]|uniref:glycosyltransferase n=1 Tax=Methanothrix sp. TaxID=90426 RepID=UPI003BB69D09